MADRRFCFNKTSEHVWSFGENRSAGMCIQCSSLGTYSLDWLRRPTCSGSPHALTSREKVFGCCTPRPPACMCACNLVIFRCSACMRGEARNYLLWGLDLHKSGVDVPATNQPLRDFAFIIHVFAFPPFSESQSIL
jgi:hypothetical protein